LGTLYREAPQRRQFPGAKREGDGVCAGKPGGAPNITGHLAGLIRVNARSLDGVEGLLVGNPVFEAGGTIVISELPRTARSPIRYFAGTGAEMMVETIHMPPSE